MVTLLYNPDRKSKEDLINEFVIRTDTFAQIFDDIKSSAMKHPEQNYLLLGQRGTGKTTLINRIKYAIEDDVSLSKKIIPIALSEEQYYIGELSDLWENIAEILEEDYGFEGISADIHPLKRDGDFESRLFNIVINYLDRHKKKIVLFIDNIGQLLSKFNELEIRRLREILQTKPHIRLIAGSPVTLQSLHDYHQPLYEFFKVVQLRGLNSEEAVTLLRKLAELHNESSKIEKIIKDSPGRIEVLRTLSGGVPRTIVLLFQVFIDSEHGTAITDLEKILDAVTPLYKHRMDDLPAQQQRIVDAVARNWEAVSVKELTEKLRIESKIISSQLRQMEKNQIIEKRTTDTKNHLYLLRERFFNIWYLMRYGKKQDRQRVIWLVKFLETWCDDKEMEKRIKDYIRKASDGALDVKTLELYAEVYSHFEKVKPDTKFLLKDSAPEYVKKHINISDEEFDQAIGSFTRKKQWRNLVNLFISRENYSDTQKKKLFELCMGDEFVDFINAAKEWMEKKVGEEISPLFALIGFYTSIYLATAFLSRKEETKLEENSKRLLSAFRYLKRSSDDTEFEKGKLLAYFYVLLVLGYYKLFESNYKQIESVIDGDPSFTHIYLTGEYLSSGNNQSVLQKVGSELADSIISAAQKITKERAELNKKA